MTERQPPWRDASFDTDNWPPRRPAGRVGGRRLRDADRLRKHRRRLRGGRPTPAIGYGVPPDRRRHPGPAGRHPEVPHGKRHFPPGAHTGADVHPGRLGTPGRQLRRQQGTFTTCNPNSRPYEGSPHPGCPHAGSPTPAALTWAAPTRKATDKRWCEDVTLAFHNSGGTAVRSGTVTLGTHIIGSLGIDWATIQSTERLPTPIAANTHKNATWTVCVDAWRVPLGMHIETRDVSVEWH
ncbi:hypothetical protein N7U49_25620 [Streptomyces sp. AD2-2]|nr:hypothetical protein N7U49_25620 [Streptomyces sp. AD2-2]